MTQGKVVERERRLYWLNGEDRDLLVFDAGGPGGNIHIYEHKESRPAAEIVSEYMREVGVDQLPREMERVAVWQWASRRRLRHSWRICD